MSVKQKLFIIGALTGGVTGILGSGGGALLVPLLSPLYRDDPDSLFPAALTVTFPVCAASLLQAIPFSVSCMQLLPYLLGGLFGGMLAFIFRKRIPTSYLHRIFGLIALLGGFRCLF